MIKGKLHKYGYVSPVITPDNYLFGAGKLEQTILEPTGQWDNSLPVYEPQYNKYFDSFGCTVWGTLNATEIILKRLTGVEANFSERFTYILAKVVPPGSNPHHISETIRTYGLIDEVLLPMTPEQDFLAFLRPNPMTKEYLDKGLEFRYEVKHEWLWGSNNISQAEKNKIIKENLKYTPVAISVTAWFEANGVFVDNGLPNTHWCVCYGYTNKGWKVFDSYNQSHKIVSFNHKIEVAKGYRLMASTRLPQISLIQKIIGLMQRVIELLKEPEYLPIPESLPPQTSRLNGWAKAIETFEKAPKWWNNPGAIRGTDGKFLLFKTYEEGFDYLLDYLRRASTGKHKAYPKGGETTLLGFFKIYAPVDDNNNPNNYANFVAGKLGITLDTKIGELV
jgi:hypothetical protein